MSISSTIIKYIRELPLRSAPLDSDMIPCAGEDGNTYRTTRGAIRAELTAPAGHAASHKHGGSDEIATATPAPNAIPKATSGSKLDGWISLASVSTPGLVELATDGETSGGVAVQGNDSRIGKITGVRTEGIPGPVTRLAVDSGQSLSLEIVEDGGQTAVISIGSGTEDDLGVVRLAPDGTVGSQTVVQSTDSRLSDARTPTSHVHAGTDITSGTIAAARLPDATTSAKGIVELATSGESASGVVVQGNDERLLKPIRKATTTTISGSATLTPDPELTRSVVSGNTYYFRLVVHVDDAGSVGITYTLDGTATYSHIRYQTYALGNVSWSILNSDRVSTIGTTSQVVGDTSYCIYIDGSCVVTGSGTIEFNWAPSSVVIDDVSVREASTFELTLAQ